MGAHRSSERVTFTVPCCGDSHRIFVKGFNVRLLDHPGVSLRTLAAEKEMQDDTKKRKNTCLDIAYALVSTGDYFSSANHPRPFPLDALTAHIVEREPRFLRVYRQSFPIDPLEKRTSIRPSHVLLHAVDEALQRWQLRSTPSVGHDVKVVSGYRTQIQCTKRRAFRGEIKIAVKDQRRTTWRQQVTATIHEPSWARIYTLCRGLVEGKYFVTTLLKERSRTDLRVRFAYQSRGYKIAVSEGDIHLGSDGVWRLIG